VKEFTFDGESDVGSGNDIEATISTGYDKNAEDARPFINVLRAMDALEAVRRANQSFYDAFEQRDLDAMSDLWEHSERVTCTHPGWPTLRGWGKVASSFFALFSGSQRMQFLLTNEHVEVDGSVAWVSVDENLLGDQGGNTVAALNVFTYQAGGERWRLVCHHGSVVTAGIDVQ
jgi:ketosteroid isomerase-like protein